LSEQAIERSLGSLVEERLPRRVEAVVVYSKPIRDEHRGARLKLGQALWA